MFHGMLEGAGYEILDPRFNSCLIGRARVESEVGASNVYRADPESGEVQIAADDFEMPNGLAFSPDEKFLYVANIFDVHHRR